MINMLLGLPGGGKSYEAVVYHILPALALGRKVITNLALNLENILALHPEYSELIEIRTGTLKPRPAQTEEGEGIFNRITHPFREQRYNTFPFSNLEDYGDPWRHPENGSGPLYVIDECHICLPKVGTPVKVEEWFSMHRHEFADVLLITQTYGKVNQAVREIVQVCYRVKKATAFGFNSKYIRKVQDGIRGEVVNTGIREYKPQFFKFYKSHTKSGAGVEMASQDIKPIWKNWTFIGAGCCLLFVVGMFTFADMKNPLNASSHVQKNRESTPTRTLAAAPVDAPASSLPRRVPADHDTTPVPVPQVAEATAVIDDPFKEKGLHLVGYMKSIKDGKPFERWMFAISQNGQHMLSLSNEDLAGSGYTWKPHSECSGVLVLGNTRRPVSCDSPQIHLGPPKAGGAA